MILRDELAPDSPLLLDRGLAYGDGLFETIALRDGRFLSWSAHIELLLRGWAAWGIATPAAAQLRNSPNGCVPPT